MWEAAKELLPLLLQGTQVTLQVAYLSAIVAILAAFTAGICRLSKSSIVRHTTMVYVEVFRGTSLLVQLFWLYFCLPFMGIELPKLFAAVLAIGLNYGAYGSEIVRSSIIAIPKGQREAAIALNMTPVQTMTQIIIPQAFVRMLPPFGNLLIELVKGTSLIYFITLTDLTYQAMILRNNNYELTPYIFLFLLCIYFVMNYAISIGISVWERRITVGRT